MQPFYPDISSFLDPAEAAALQRIQEAVTAAYVDDKRVTPTEVSAIARKIVEGGVSDSELAAARFLMQRSRSYLPQLRGKVDQARTDERRLRDGSGSSVASAEAYRRAREDLDSLSTALEQVEAVTGAYRALAEQLEAARKR